MLPTSITGGTNSDLKNHNLSAVLTTLLYKRQASRIQLAHHLGVSGATITNITSELIQQGLITEGGKLQEDGAVIAPGRPQRALELVPDSRFAIAIHIDVADVYIGITDLLANRLETCRIPITDKDACVVLDQSLAAVEALIKKSEVESNRIVGVGVAASGLVNAYDGINTFAPNLGWRNVPIGTYLSERLDLPVVVDNNVRTMALYEAMFGGHYEARALAFVYAGIGVGAGLVVDGNPYRGAAAGAGEIGHMTVITQNGALCHCGNHGCLETIFSKPALTSAVHELTGTAHSWSEVMALARENDTLRALLEDRAEYVGIALANLVNIFNPELIVLGGLFIDTEAIVLPVIQETIRNRAFDNLGQQVTVKVTELGNQIGTAGAASLALDSFLYRPQLRLQTTPT